MLPLVSLPASTCTITFSSMIRTLSMSPKSTSWRAGTQSLSLSAAQASIALSAVSGGMFEIGDDMLVLGSGKDRLALVENRELLNMAKVGRAHTPVD